MENITLELNINEINMILATLGKHPFDEVVALVGNIRSQAESQLQLMQADAPEGTEAP